MVVSGEKLLCRDTTEGYVIRIYALDDLMQTGPGLEGREKYAV